MPAPTTTSELLGGQAAPRTITHKERVYSCQPIRQKVKSQIERRLEEDRRRGLLGPDPEALPLRVLTAALSLIADEVAQKKFAFGGLYYLQWVASQGGVQGMTEILFNLSEADALDLLLARAAEVGQIMLLMIAEALPPELAAKVQQAMVEPETTRPESPDPDNPDPNSPAHP